MPRMSLQTHTKKKTPSARKKREDFYNLDNQNSAVKGAMSLLSSVQPQQHTS